MVGLASLSGPASTTSAGTQPGFSKLGSLLARTWTPALLVLCWTTGSHISILGMGLGVRSMRSIPPGHTCALSPSRESQPWRHKLTGAVTKVSLVLPR